MKTFLLLLVPGVLSIARAEVIHNNWTNPASARWDSPTNWSLGVLPASNQTVNITNAGYKTVNIDYATIFNFPASMTVSNLLVAAPTAGFSTLLLNSTGVNVPLEVLNNCTIGTNGTLANSSSWFEVAAGGGLLVDGGAFTQEGGLTVVNGPVSVRNGSLNATNGNLTLGNVTLGDTNSGGTLNHDGGSILAQNVTLENGGYNLASGILYAIGGTEVRGFGTFYQTGGTNYGDITTDTPSSGSGQYIINGGLAEGNVLTVRTDFNQGGGLVDMETVDWTGNNGTVLALGTLRSKVFNVHANALLFMGQGNIVPGSVETDSLSISNSANVSVTTYNLIVTNSLDIRGDSTNALARLALTSGTGVSSTVRVGTFTIHDYSRVEQFGPTITKITTGLFMEGGRYDLQDGILEGPYVGVGANATFRHWIRGTNLVHGVLSITGTYDLSAGTLVTDGIYLRGSLVLNDPQSTNFVTSFTNNGLIDLGGTLSTRWLNAWPGQVQLSTNATIRFIGPAAQLHFAPSSGVSWIPGALLTITNWNSSSNHHIFFGTGASGLTASQLAQIQFSNPGGFAPGNYPAQLLSTGELVPVQSPVGGDINSWIKPTSGNWEEPSSWSLGVLPNQSQFVYITNSGWKAVAIGANTAQNFSNSMTIQQLEIASPADSYNVFLMNFAGFERPLQTTLLTVRSNSSVVVQSSMLEVINTDTNGNTGNIRLGGSFNHGDFSLVKVHGTLDVRAFGGSIQPWLAEPGRYFLTNGSLTVGGLENIGSMSGRGEFVQYGGFNNVGSLKVNTEGKFDLYGGQTTATNGITVGDGDFATAAFFYQHGGSVNADTVVNGNYILNGGTLTGRMSVAESGQRVNGSVLQTGGTNSAVSMDLGHPNRFGGAAIYTLSNGVVHVDSSTIFRGGWFTQYNGLHTIVSNLVMEGTFVGPGNVYAEYGLVGGRLSAMELGMSRARLYQSGGSNLIAGDLVIGTTPSSPSQAGASQYALGGGLLSARNVIVNANNYGGFRQTGGTNQISEQLTVRGVTNGPAENYTLEGGTLAVKDMYVAAGAFFQHTSGNITHSGVLNLNQGDWRAATGDHVLGPLQLTGQPSNSAISFPNGSSILRLANSSGQAWSPGANLYITNWNGSASGGGATRLYFGSNANGLTSQQLAQIQFSNPGGFAPGNYPAQLLSTGELVPVQSATLPTLQSARSGSALVLTWTGNYQLLSATNIAGPFMPVPGASSPWTNLFTKPREFFRLQGL